MSLRIPQLRTRAQHVPSGRTALAQIPASGEPAAAVHSPGVPPPAFDFGRIAIEVPRVIPASARIQPKLAVSAPEDAEEKEADRVADEIEATSEVMTLADPGGGEGKPPPAAGDDARPPEEPDEIQRSAAGESAAAAGEDLQARLVSRLGQGTALPAATRRLMESAIGASFRDVRVHTDSEAAELSRSLRASAFTYGRDIFFGAGKFDPRGAGGRHLLAHELAHVVQQRGTPDQAIQRKKEAPPKPVAIQFDVTLNEPVSGSEFFLRAIMQYTGLERADAEKQIRDGKFTCSHTVCSTGVTPDLVGKPIPVTVQTGGLSKREKAAVARRTAELSTLPAAERNAVNEETDRRFWSRSGRTPGTPLGKGPEEEGLRQLWLRTRERVIQDQESIDKLSPPVKDFINPGGKRQIRPEEYTTVLRIAKKLESFSESDWLLYKRRVNASTDDYERLERSIDAFQSQQVAEKATMDRLRGAEGLYRQVKQFKALQRHMLTPPLKSDVLPLSVPGNAERYEAEKAATEAALTAAGFASIEDFDAAGAAFVALFRKRAVEITLLALRESEKLVVAERTRYEQPAENAKLFAQLAPMRAAVEESQAAFSAALPTLMELKMETTTQTPRQQEALARYRESNEKADAARQKNEAQNPILKDPRLRNESLNVTDANALGEVLRSNADDRLADIAKTRVNVLENGDLVFKLDRITALTRQELGVTPDSVYDLTLKDYQDDLAFEQILIAIATGALAIGLVLLSFGGGTVAVLAAGAGLGLSVYQAGEEWEKYSAAQAAAHTSFDKALSVSSEEPSAVWLAVALIGVGLDGAALASAFKAAAPAARVLQATGDVARFEAELAKAAELSAAIKKSLGRAARAETEFRAAAEELSQAMWATTGRLYMGGLDPDVIAKATKAAYYAARKGNTDFEVFRRELNLQKFARNIDFNSLNAEQLEALQKAFQVGAKEVAADATKFSVKVPFKAGERVVTFDDAGKMLLDGKPVTERQLAEVYNKLDLTHAVKGHGPDKPLVDVINEARLVDATHPGLSGKFNSHQGLLEAVEKAKAEWKVSKETEIFIDALPNEGRAFARADKIPSGAQTVLSFDTQSGVLEIAVKRIRAVFRADGSLVTIYPVGF